LPKQVDSSILKKLSEFVSEKDQVYIVRYIDKEVSSLEAELDARKDEARPKNRSKAKASPKEKKSNSQEEFKKLIKSIEDRVKNIKLS
jgi:hypothetical protein